MSELERLARALTAQRDAARTLSASAVDEDSPIGRLAERVANLMAEGDRLFNQMIGDSPVPTSDETGCRLTVH
jgi:hypothetical protein